jgi:hypothetical protein
MKKYLFLLAFFGFLLQGCVKTATVPIDHVNKFTCKVNGVFWEAIPFQNSILGNDLMATKMTFFDFLTINAQNIKKKQALNIHFNLDDSLQIRKNISLDTFLDFNGCGNNFQIDSNLTNEIKITFHNRVSKIIQGTFKFSYKKQPSSCKDSIFIITDGFFDLLYQ